MPTATIGHRLTSTFLLATAMGLAALPLHAQEWTRFRGPNGTGISEQKGLPKVWGPESVRWDIKLPGIGHSSPVLWGERLFVTSAVDEGNSRLLFCLDSATGKEIWSREMSFGTFKKHVKNSYASSTPAVDAEHVYVAFADVNQYVLAAYDHEGNEAWKRDLGPFVSQHGMGVSPIVYEGMVILPNDQDGPSSVLAVNSRTGDTVWEVPREPKTTSYATPMILHRDGQAPELICLSDGMGITSLDPFTGKQNWSTGELPQRTVASPVYAGGLLFVTCGQAGRGTFMAAVDPDLQSSASAGQYKYTRERELPYVPTLIAYEGLLFLWGDQGVVTCIQPETGKSIWTNRVGGNYSGSPIIIDGCIYCMDEEGQVVVIRAAARFELVGTTPLGDPSHATPAVANGNLYLRTFHRLVCVGPGKKS